MYSDLFACYDIIKSELENKEHIDEKFIKNITNAMDVVKKIKDNVDKFDYDANVKANGYRTFIKIIYKYCLIVNDCIKKNNIDDDIINCSYLMSEYANKIDQLFSIALNYYNSNINQTDIDNNSLDSEIATQYRLYNSPEYFIIENRKLPRQFSSYYRKYNSFWLPQNLRILNILFTYCVAVFKKLPYSLSVLWSKSAFEYYIDQSFNYSTTFYPVKILGVIDNFLINKVLINLRHLFKPVKTFTYYVGPRQNEWLIFDGGITRNKKYINDHNNNNNDHNNNNIIINDDNKNNNHINNINNNNNNSNNNTNLLTSKSFIRVRCSKHTKFQTADNTIILHAHGGAFMVHSPDCHEEYLRTMVEKLNGIPLLSVDYSLYVKYTVSLQEMLDVYLWLVSGSEDVKKKIGFNPKKVILCGDSAGGTLMFALLTLLNNLRNLRKEDSNSTFIFPSAFIAIYPKILIDIPCASSILSKYDPIINSSLFVIANKVNAYGLPSNKDLTSKPDFEKLTLNTTDELIIEHYKELTRLTNTYAQLFNICNFEDLKDVSLHAITGEYDPLLDDSISLAQRWKGPKTIDIMEDTNHGFMNLQFFDKSSRAAFERCITRLLEACGIHK